MNSWENWGSRFVLPPDPVRLWRDRLLSTLYTTGCAVCRVPEAGPLCPECRRGLWRETRRVVGEEAPVPGRPIRGWSLGLYRRRLRRAIRALKFEGALELAHVLGQRLAETVPDELLRPDAMVVPVPLHPQRRRERGFDHVAPLAWHLARSRGLRPSMQLLERIRLAPPSHLQGKESRQSRAEGAFRLTPGARPPRAVVLVDDVWTTGATARAVLGTLAEAGVEHLSIVALARALPGRLE